jgi:UDP-N-acetylmuramyl pentapeptide synthase
VDSQNGRNSLLKLILGMPRGTGYCVMELSGSSVGAIDPLLSLARPGVGVVTTIGGDHYRSFRSLDAIADEKGKLVAALPADGMAVLNADDPRVLGMRARTRASVLTYGESPEADLRAVDVRGAWPDRLGFTAVAAGQRQEIRTRLCGAHTLPSVLAALGAGLALGVPLDRAAAAVAGISPRRSRMQPVESAGITFVRDEWKAPYWTIDPSIDFVRCARARRKWIVLGTISDMPGNSGRKYRRIARRALEAADRVVFVNSHAGNALAGLEAESAGRLQVFDRIVDARASLRTELRRGDLVLVKGSGQADHLARLALSFGREVACWRDRCGRAAYCDDCALLAVPAPPPRAGAAH